MAPYPNWRQVAKTSRHRKRRVRAPLFSCCDDQTDRGRQLKLRRSGGLRAGLARKALADVRIIPESGHGRERWLCLFGAKTGRMRCSDSAWTDLRSNCLLQYLKRAVSIIVGASGSACERIELHCTRAEANRRVASPWK